MQPRQIERIKALFPFLSDVSYEDWQKASIITIEPNARHPIQEGHTLEHAVLVLDGSIRIFQLSESGREVTLYRVQSGEGCVLMLASILGETEYGANAVVETTSELMLLPAETFKQWMVRYPEINKYVYRQFLQRMKYMTNLLDHIAFKPIEYRVADFLLRKACPTTQSLTITHDQIAAELGTAREVVSRALKSFEKSGLLRLRRGKIEMIDWSHIERISRFM